MVAGLKKKKGNRKRLLFIILLGEMAEWLKVVDCKSIRFYLSQVRILLSSQLWKNKLNPI